MKQKLLILLLLFCPIMMGYTNIDKESIDVTVGNVDVPIYNLEVSWGPMEFTYQETINYVWDNNTHTYELSKSTYKWNTSNNTIDINNKSTIPVNINLQYISINENVNGNFDISKITIKPNEKIISKLVLDGKISSNNTNYIKVGTINLNVA